MEYIKLNQDRSVKIKSKEHYSHLGYDAVSLVRIAPTSERDVLLATSWQESKPNLQHDVLIQRRTRTGAVNICIGDGGTKKIQMSGGGEVGG